MSLASVYRKRLLKLAEHLESDYRGHKKFDFNIVASGDPKVSCGTAGCALGECPIAFPRNFKFDILDGDFEIALRKGQPGRDWLAPRPSFLAAEKFFGLTRGQADHLFCPHRQNTEDYGGRELGRKAKPSSVAKNIRIFVNKMSK